MCDMNNNVRTTVENIGSSYAIPSLANNNWKQVFLNMHHDPISRYVRREDLYALYQLATNPKYSSSDMKVRFEVYDSIMNPLGFIRSFSGTNRVVYRHNADSTFLLKIGLDSVGINDNKLEYKNQFLLNPFVPRVYDISPDGVMIMIERVHPIMNRKEFEKQAPLTFNITDYWVSHGFVLEDIGTDYFMNWGVRDGFGPVLLDFPYFYRLNKDRLKCTSFKNGERCNGDIKYDPGFNHLTCQKCGRVYRAKEIGSRVDYLVKRKGRGIFRMSPIKFTFTKGNRSVTHVVTDDGVDYITTSPATNITKNDDNKNYQNSIKTTKPEYTKKPQNEYSFNKFSLNNVFNKTLERIRTEYKIDKFSNKLIEYVANYLDVYHNDFILNPSVLLESSTKITDEIKESIKSKLSEESGVKVNNVTEINMGEYNLYIPSKPIINISKYAECIEVAVDKFIDEEKEESSTTEEDANGNNGLVKAINDITNDESITFDSSKKEDKKVTVEPHTAEMEHNNQVMEFNSSNPLGVGVIKASDAVEIPAKQYGVNDEF